MRKCKKTEDLINYFIIRFHRQAYIKYRENIHRKSTSQTFENNGRKPQFKKTFEIIFVEISFFLEIN